MAHTGATITLNPLYLVKFRARFSLKFFWLTVLASIMSLLFFYVIQVSSFTKAQYLIQNYEKRILSLSKINESLEVNFSQLDSLVNVEKYLAVQNFEKVSKVKYIQLMESQVARR